MPRLGSYFVLAAACMGSALPRGVGPEARASALEGQDGGAELEDVESIRAKLAQGDRKGARALLDLLLVDGVEGLLEGSEDEAAEAWLKQLAGACEQLGDQRGRLVAVTALHERLSARLPADHYDVLDSQLSVAALQSNLGDPAGARVAFAHIVATWEDQLPADHGALLIARRNLAMTCFLLGDHEQALLQRGG